MTTLRALAVAWLSTLLLASTPPTADAPDPEALMRSGHFKKARPLVEERFRGSPLDAHSMFLMGRMKSAFGTREEAIALLEQAVSRNPNMAQYHAILADQYAQKARKAGFFEKVGLARKIKQHLEAAVALDPRNWDMLDGMLTFYLEAPGILGGDKKKAQEMADRAVKADPVHGWLMQAHIARQNKDTSRLEEFYRKAVAAGANDFEAEMQLAAYYGGEQVKKYDLAEKYAREAMRIAPDRNGSYAVLAIVYVMQERWADLDKVLAAAEKANPEDLSPMYAAAQTLLTAGKDLPRAERYFRRYLQQQPEANTPSHAGAHWRLGQIYQKQGRKNEAIAELQTALSLDPSLEPAKKDLKALR